MADSLADLATRQQVALERIKSGFDREFKGVARTLRAKIREIFSRIDVDTLDELSLGELNALLVKLSKEQTKITAAYVDDFEKSLKDVGAMSAKLEVSQLATLDTGDLAALSVVAPSANKIYKEALRQPIQAVGQMLEPFIAQFPPQDVARMNKVIRTGYAQGTSNQDMVRELVGTKKNNYKDGQVAITERNASAVTHTATQHINTVARQATWQSDDALGLGYYWVATLDRRTTQQCRGLDETHGVGKEPFEYGKGPLPPIHVRCRSTTVPQTAPEYEFLQEGRTRAAVGTKPGQVDGQLTYYSWLKTQPASFQDFAIGPTRGKLLRNGGLSSEQFANLSLDKNFQPLTLAEMEEANPAAFKRAGVKP